MKSGTVVLVGSLPVEHLALDDLTAEFGWGFQKTSSLAGLPELRTGHNLVTVLFSPKNLGLPWRQALHMVLDMAPGALPILCHEFAENSDWPRMAEAGAFHSLLLPFSASELRRSLGFVWSAKHGSSPLPAPRAAKSVRRFQRASGNVA